MNLLRKIAMFALLLICALGCDDTAPVGLGSIVGTVTDGVLLEPLQGVSVSISPTGKTMTTGSDGKFEFPEIEAGQYTVSVSKENYNSDSKIVNVQSGTTTADFIITTGNGSIELSKSTLDFGTSDNILVFDIENIGKSDLTYTIECSEYEWMSVSPKSGSISSSRIEAITVTVDRSKIDENKSVTLPISSDAGSAEITVNVTNYVATANLSVTPTTLDFGETSTVKYFTIKNDGTADLTFEFVGLADWFDVSCSKYTLSASESTTVTVTADRDKLTQTESHELVISSNSGNESVTLNATYVAKTANLSVTPTTLDFGETSTVKYFTIKNDGTADLTFEFVGLADWFDVSCSKYTLSASESTTVTVTVDRNKISTSTSGSLNISSNGGNASVELSVTVAIPTPELTMYTTEIDFGETSSTKTFTVYNTGDATMTFSVNESLSWLSASYTGTVAAGSSSVVTLTLDRDAFYGDVSETISITSDGGSASITVKAYEPIDYGAVTSPYLGLDLEVTDSYISGSYIYVEYKIVWNGSGSCDFYVFSYRSTAYDDEGNVYTTDFENVSLGGSSYTESKFLTSIQESSVIKGGVRFKNISSNATKLTSILLQSAHDPESGSYETGIIIFNNVPIIR